MSQERHCSFCDSLNITQIEEGVWLCGECDRKSIFSREDWNEQLGKWLNIGKFISRHYQPVEGKEDIDLDEIEDKVVVEVVEEEPFIIDQEIEKRASKSIKSKIKDFKIRSLYFKDAESVEERIKFALLNRKHIILIGPPGTGKSKLAKELCSACCGKDGYIMSTATSDWSTFETIGGYRLKKDGDLEFSPGIFLQCFKTIDDAYNNKWLIIDEINRADIDKAFGSLFSALTGDNVTIPFRMASGKLISIIGKPEAEVVIKENYYMIPHDWRIIATMNTFDKSSLYEMSYAFMRRFAFIPINNPSVIDKDLVKEYVSNCWNLESDETICLNLAELWGKINTSRSIGPAIIEDMYRYIQDTNDYVSATIMYVFPQFEGLSDEIIINFYKDVEKFPFMAEKQEELKQFASEFFDIHVKKFETTYI